VGLLAALFAFQLTLAAQPTAKPGNRITNVIDDRVTVSHPLDVHPLARPEFDQGEAAPDTRMDRMVLVLTPDAKQQEALDELVVAQKDPESPEYRRWLTPAAFGSRFGVSAADLDQIVNWLTGHGFEVEPVSPAARSVVFSGSVAQVATAFHTAIHIYNVNGKRHYANASAPQIPEALAEVVRGVVSLHDFHAHALHRAAEPIVPGYAAPLFADAAGNHYLAPADFAAIYDSASLYTSSVDGTGQSIAIVGRTDINVSDVQAFRSYFGLPVNNPTIVLNGTDPGILSVDEETEATLDVEWSGAAAPHAAIQLVVSASTNTSDGATLSAQYIVNQNLAPVASLSFGSCELDMGASENQFWNGLWQQAAVQGITVLVASGDSGAAGCDADSSSAAVNPASVNGLCSSPFSTCVGGTELNDTANPSAYWSASGSALGYIPETAWNESGSVSGGSDLWATGGGASMVYPKPAWQTGPGVPADGWRDVPDVALSAAGHDGYVIYMNGNYYAVGGTSAAAPSFAGLMALAAQQTGAWLGCVNPNLYSLAVSQAAGGGAVFHDITLGNNTVPGLKGFNAGPGYDQATGLGSVDAAQLIKHWSDAAASGTFHLGTSPASVSLVAGAHATVAVQLTVSGGFSSPVTLSAGGVPSGLTASFSSATLTAASSTSTLTLTASARPPAGSHTITIVASGGGIARYLPVVVTVSACTYSISPTSASPAATAASYTINVTAATGCSWTAVSGSSWLTITSGKSGTAGGSGSVNYSVAANSATTSRSGSIAIAGVSLTVTQAAAAFSLSPVSVTDGAAAATGSVTVTAASTTASWTAVSNAAWIAITSGGVSAGSGSVAYSVAANSGAARTGTVTMAGLTFTVNQAAAALGFTLNAAPSSLALAAGSSVTVGIGVTATGGFQGSVTLAFSGLPAGVTAAFSPTAIAAGGTATLKLTAAAAAASSSATVTLTGTSGSLTATLPLSLTVSAVPAFSLSASPSPVALPAGTSASTPVSVAAISGFAGSVTLSVSGLPSGVTAAFTPTAVAAGVSSTLKLTASASAAVSSAGLTVSGASGSLTATAPLSLNVTSAPGFTVSATPTSLGLVKGASAIASVSVAATSGFAGNVTLAVSGLPAGVTAAFSPATVAPGATSTLTLTASASAGVSSSSISITGSSGSTTGTAPIGLSVTAAGFAISASPASVALAAGASATTSVNVTAKGAFTGTVTLGVSGLPVGVTAAFSPATVAMGGTATLKLTAAASAAASSGAFAVTGSSGSVTGATPLNLGLTAAAGFTLAAASPALTLAAGSSATTSISVAAVGGFTGNVALAASGLPAGVTAALTPASSAPGGSSTLTLTAAGSAPVSSASITIAGSSGSLAGTAKIALSVTAAEGVSLSAASPSLTAAAGSSVTTVISVVGTGGLTGSVALAVSGLPVGVTATFAPASVAPGGNSTLTLAVAASAAASSINLTLTGASGSATGTASIVLKVTPAPSFTLTAGPSSLTVAAGSSASTSISVVGANGFTGNVALTVAGLPAGVTAAFSQATAAVGTSTLKVTAASSAAVAGASLTLTGISGSLTASIPIGLSVTPPPGFTLSAALPAISVMAGSSASTTINVAGTGGFTGSVTLSVAGLPAGVTATFTPASIAPGGSSTLKLQAASSAAATSANVTLQGGSGTLTATASLSLSVTLNIPPSFTVRLAAPALTVGLGLTASTTVGVAAAGGFTGSVALTATGLPCGVTAVFSPSSVPAGGTATLTLASNYGSVITTNIVITGVSGSLSASTPLNLTANNEYVGFQLFGSPVFLDLKPGGTAITTISMQPWLGFTGTATLQAVLLPPGVTATFSPAAIGPGTTSTLTLTASASAPAPTGYMQVQGMVGHLEMGILRITLNNDVPGFTLEPPSIPASTLTQIIDTTLVIDFSGGFSGPVQLSFSGLPPGVVGSFQEVPANTTNVHTVQFELAAGVTAVIAPSTPVTITGTSGSLTAATTFNIAVAPTKGFSVNPPVQGWSASDYFTTPVGGTGTAKLLGLDNGKGFTISVSGAPPSAATTIVAAPPSEYVLNVATTTKTAPGCYMITYVGNAPGQPPYTAGWPLYLTVTQ
jgi:uncharacterized membrane protein